MKIKRIGLDFDGVAVNSYRTKQELAQKHFGISISMSQVRREDCYKKGFNKRNYEKLQEMTYSAMDLKPVQGFLKHSRQLMKEGHYLFIVSYRKKRENDPVANFLQDHLLEIPYIITDWKPKSIFCKNLKLDAFVEDHAKHLIDLEGIVKSRFLFDTPYNKDIKVPKGIELIKYPYWMNLHERIDEIG